MSAAPFPAPVLPLHRSLAGVRVVAYAHRAELMIAPGLEALHTEHADFYFQARTYLRDCDDLYLLVDRAGAAIAWRQPHTATLAELARHADNERLLFRRRQDDLKQTLTRRAAAPLRPGVPQVACDVGLFGDTHRQLDLVDLVRTPCPSK